MRKKIIIVIGLFIGLLIILLVAHRLYFRPFYVGEAVAGIFSGDNFTAAEIVSIEVVEFGIVDDDPALEWPPTGQFSYTFTQPTEIEQIYNYLSGLQIRRYLPGYRPFSLAMPYQTYSITIEMSDGNIAWLSIDPVDIVYPDIGYPDTGGNLALTIGFTHNGTHYASRMRSDFRILMPIEDFSEFHNLISRYQTREPWPPLW